MTRKRHTPEQIIRKLQTAEQILNRGETVADLCRALEVSWGSPRLKLGPHSFPGVPSSRLPPISSLRPPSR